MKTQDHAADIAILKALEEEHGFVSGEKMSRRLGLSRAAIWKRIEALRDTGYDIKARSRRGYLLTQKPDRLSSWEVSRRLETRRIGREMHTFAEVTSTNEVAYEMALKGIQEGAVVLAESQTQGRGRMNRSWVSPCGKNLYLSLILRPSIPPRLVPVLTYVGAISTAEALVNTFSLKVDLKWPNDILAGGRKLAGLLNEVRAEADRVVFVVLGFGVNLNMGEELFPPELRKKATSVIRELGHRVSRVEFTRSLLKSTETWYDAFLVHGACHILESWEARACIRGKAVEVKSFGRLYRGVVQGLDDAGALILREQNGQTTRIVAGDLREPSVERHA